MHIHRSSGRSTLTRLAAGAAVATVALVAGTARAETVSVLVSGFDFTPDDVTIQVGDTIEWVWGSGLHNVVSGSPDGKEDGNFSSGTPVMSPGTTFSITFDQAFLDANPMPGNVYPYFCEVHLAFDMVGTITVEEPLQCVGDLDDDQTVGVGDLLDLLAAWGDCDGEDCPADLDDDETVGVGDLLELLAAWGDC